MTTLVEGVYGHGGNRSLYHRAKKKFKRTFYKRIGRASIPFDWATGFSSLTGLTVPVKNQFSSSSCGGQAGSYALAIALARLNNHPYQELSAKSIYSKIAVTGGGSYISTLTNQLINGGATDESLVPSYYTNGTTDEAFMTSRAWINQTTTVNAIEKAGWKRIYVGLDQESIAEAIRDHGFVICELDGRNNGTWLSEHPYPPNSVYATSGAIWAHYLCFIGADSKKGANALYAINSWGQSVGNGGIQYFTEDYVKSGFVDAFTLVRNIVDPATIPVTNWIQRFISWVQKLYS